MLQIRKANAGDQAAIEQLHLQAFPETERTLIARLATQLLNIRTVPPTLSLVAEIAGNVVGHVAFSPVTPGKDITTRVYILAPLAVAPERQRQGVGAALIEYGLSQMSASGVDVVLVYGDPAYYGRFGFNAEMAQGFTPPYALAYPHGWQAVALGEFNAEAPASQISCVAPLCIPALW